MRPSSFESLDELAASLPFHVDDVDAANEWYSRWRHSRRPDDLEVVQLWTYCFIRRYFLVKFIQETSYAASDLDEVIDKTFLKIEQAEQQVKNPARYASWVSVVCKNTFRNYLRGRRRPLSIDAAGAPPLVGEVPKTYNDIGLAHQALLRAIDRLPPHLQPCVRLRFLDGLSYEEIGAQTGQALPSIRAYIYKAIRKLRDDQELSDYFQ